MPLLDEIQKALPDEAKNTIGEKVFYLGSLATTAGLTFFNNNAEGIQAVCTVLVTITVLLKFYKDRKSDT